MKSRSLALSLLLVTSLLLTGCGSAPKSEASPPVRDQHLATQFTDQGVKVYYTLTGKLEKIEVAGEADAWKGNVDLQAEADAYAKLVKFLYGADVTHERKLKIIGRSIEKARQHNTDRSHTVDGVITTTDRDIDIEERGLRSGTPSDSKAGSAIKPGAERSDSAERAAKAVNETMMDSVTTLTASGRLTGMRKVRDSVVNQGKTYVAVYQWSERDQASSEAVRSRMNASWTK